MFEDDEDFEEEEDIIDEELDEELDMEEAEYFGDGRTEDISEEE